MTEQIHGYATCLVLTSGLSSESLADADLARAADAVGLKLRRADDVLQPNRSLLETVLDRIRAADVVVAVASETHSSWLWLQVGAAVAFGRPVVVIVTSPFTLLPPELGDLFKVGPIISQQALTHALRRAYKSSPSRVRSQIKPTGVPLGSVADFLNDRLSVSGQEGSQEFRFSSWFADVLRRAEVSYDTEATLNVFDSAGTKISTSIDFVVTANELDGNLGNPLPVELKTRGSLEVFLRSRESIFSTYMASTGATTLLLVALAGVKFPQLMPLAGGSLLACDARSLVSEMRDQTFGQAVIKLRNQATREGGLL